MGKVLVFTVIYPQAEKYIDDFYCCLKNQTYQNFDLLIVNDGCEESMLIEFFKEFSLTVLNSGFSPSKNREIGIKYAYNNHYDNLIFCDFDDWFHYKRFEIVLQYLCKADIVVNDLNIVGENHEMLSERYFSNSINKDTIIDGEFLRTKNLLGLSNTAIKVQEKSIVDIPDELTIGDWYYFSVCAERGLSILFCEDALTDYRQHSNNLIGIDNFSVPLFRKLATLKVEHYLYMSRLFPSFINSLDEAKKLEELSDDEIIKLIKQNRKVTPHPLWWESIKN